MEKQIHKRTIIDIETGAVVQDVSIPWVGPIIEAKGPKIKMAQPPPPTQEEIEQRQLTNMLSKLQLQEMGFEEGTPTGYEHYLKYGKAEGRKWDTNLSPEAANEKYLAENPDVATAAEGYYAGKGPKSWRKRAPTKEEFEQADLEEQMMNRFKEELGRRPGEVSPEQEEALKTLYGSEQSKMDEELARFAAEQSGARGLSLNDTPLAREVLLAKGRGQTELGAARASSKLNFAERERVFNQGLAQWRSDLQQQRLANLMGATGQSANTAIGFMNARGNLKPTPYQAGGGGGFNMGGLFSGIGSAIGGLAMRSSVQFKDHIADLPQPTINQLVTALLRAPVKSWQYKNDEVKHVGPTTETLPTAVVTSDGTAISVVDMLGALLLTVQQLAKKVGYGPVQQ